MPTSLSEQVKRTQLFSRETENSELRIKEKNQRKEPKKRPDWKQTENKNHSHRLSNWDDKALDSGHCSKREASKTNMHAK